jgi:hypothetical protein
MNSRLLGDLGTERRKLPTLKGLDMLPVDSFGWVHHNNRFRQSTRKRRIGGSYQKTSQMP